MTFADRRRLAGDLWLKQMGKLLDEGRNDAAWRSMRRALANWEEAKIYELTGEHKSSEWRRGT